MNKFYVNENSFQLPWFETDFAIEILKNKKTNFIKKKDISFFIKNGYVILKNVVSDSTVKGILSDFRKIINSKNYKKNPDYFHYNNSPRIVEGWRKSKNIKQLCFNKHVINFLQKMYNKKPLPISTINFTRGTEQPLHSDYIHFGSLPELYLAGVWFALEDVSLKNGPLVVVPTSHKLNLIDFNDLKLNIPKTTFELKKNYTIYEDYLRKLIKEKKLKPKKLTLKKGDVIIWAANLLHGGSRIISKNSTRFSQVVHYHFDKLEKIYNPCFSSRMHGIFLERNLKKILIK